MKFSIRNTEVQISFTFIAISVIMFVSTNNRLYITALLSSLFHELVHIIAMLICGVKIHKISLSIFGGNILREGDTDNHLKEVIINLSAPIFNMILGLLILLFAKGSHCGYINLFIGIFNILPYYNFDGGNGLKHIFIYLIGKKKADIIILALSAVIIAVFTTISLFLIADKKVNVSIILINIYLYLSFVLRIFKKPIELV